MGNLKCPKLCEAIAQNQFATSGFAASYSGISISKVRWCVKLSRNTNLQGPALRQDIGELQGQVLREVLRNSNLDGSRPLRHCRVRNRSFTGWDQGGDESGAFGGGGGGGGAATPICKHNACMTGLESIFICFRLHVDKNARGWGLGKDSYGLRRKSSHGLKFLQRKLEQIKRKQGGLRVIKAERGRGGGGVGDAGPPIRRHNGFSTPPFAHTILGHGSYALKRQASHGLFLTGGLWEAQPSHPIWQTQCLHDGFANG